MDSGFSHIKLKSPAWREILIIRLMVIAGLFSVFNFLFWFFKEDHVGYPVFYWLLTISLIVKVIIIVHEWYHYYAIKINSEGNLTTKFRVDILTTYFPGEPYEMVINTLKAIKKIDYSDKVIYLCDEADDEYLKMVCRDLKINHVTRNDRKDAKAGNINNTLKIANGDICLILDPDHIPLPNILQRILPAFEQDNVGFVQIVQAYYNQEESLIAKGAAQQTYQFYGPMMMGMNSYGTVQAIGANCCFRRKALDEIGGHAAGLAEDMHTAMRLHAKGWKSEYVPEVLTRGLVPADIYSFYKQQLKWSKGVFDLFLNVLPKLFRNFSLRQKIHYVTIPLFYLNGFIIFVDLLIPVLALFTFKYPWKIDFITFLKYIIPLLGFMFLIRHFVQKWVLEEKERGFHLVGGILRNGSWWIYVSGIICSVLKINIPYLPTPKKNSKKIPLIIILPNVIAVIFSVFAIFYGLSRDWSPFSLLMSGFTAINIFILSLNILMGINKKQLVAQNIASVVKQLKIRFWLLRHRIYLLVRKYALVFSLSLVIYLFFSQFNMKPQEKKLKTIDTGGFYAGLYEPTFEENPTLDSLYSFQDKINKQLDIVSIYLAWNPNMDEFPGELLRQIELNQKIPMITWEPWSVKFENDSSENIFIGITKGTYNSYLDNFIDQIKKLDVPVFLRFAHEADNPMYPWSKAQPEQFKRAWQFLYHYFNQAGAYNVIWLWNPWKPSAFSSYFPGEDYVDWIGVTLLNYGLASPDSTWYTFEQLYHPIQQEIKKLPAKPVMLAEFGSTAYGGDRQLWLGEAFKKIKSYPEIKAITFFNSDQDNNWPGETSLINTSIDWKIKSDEAWVLLSSIFDDNHFVNNFAHVFSEKKSKKKVYPSSTEVIIPGNIKGVVYNPEDVFRKELLPLTRNQLEIDFNSIKLLGANTISRYTSNIYDHNVVAIAEEYDLQVIFGFDISAKVDFSDPKSRQELSEKILSTTRKFQRSESIIIWNLGNTLYNDFAKYFDKPKLNLVRRHYLTFIDSLSKQIKVITPQVPVMISLNCDEMLMNTLLHIKEIDPAIDIIGINAYYEKYLQNLEEVMLSSGINKPYFISELGHSGYWQHDLNSIQRFDLLREPSGQQKIRCLVENWEKYVLAKPTANLGAVINRWRDNLNGTLTWSGLNDIYGRKKPEYFAIRALWNNEPVELPGYSLKILMPVARLQPQVNYEITGIVTDRSGMVLFKDHSAFKYEWYVSIEEEGKVIDIKALMQKPSIKYSPWFSEKNHRLHVFAEDSEGNVFTASEAFLPY